VSASKFRADLESTGSAITTGCISTSSGVEHFDSVPVRVVSNAKRKIAGYGLTILALMAGVLGITSVNSAMAVGSGYVYASPSLNMRTDASTAAPVILSIPYHTTLTIQCVKYGSAVSNSYGTSTLWDYVTYGGRSGFVADQWVWTGTSAPTAPVCGAAPAPTSIQNYKSWALNSANWNSYTPSGYRGIDSDGAYGAQCADLGIAWSKWVGRRVGFDGYDTSSAYKPGWHVVGYNMSVAQPGDVVTRVNGWQHVVVVTGSPSGGRVEVIQQNPYSPAATTYGTGTSGVVWRLN